MASMDRVLELNFRSTDEDVYFQEAYDWAQPNMFQEPRHVDKIEGCEVPAQGWRMKERMKTVSVALVACLNIGVDPPGLIKLQPCARFECWVDPLTLSPQKALEQIGKNLQKQYERWQPRARYKISLDPTVDEVKKLCTSLRRNAKEERVLFHYNGHGVPSPTTNGELWVFNRNYTQYIPLSIYDLQTWMGSPSIFVYDCNNAGIIIKSFHQFAEQHEREYFCDPKSSENASGSGTDESLPPPNFSSCIQLAACSASQVLPMNPDLPADLFTACLTTPIRMALKWFVLQNQASSGGGARVLYNKLLADGINLETVDKLPGQLNDRRTLLGELNWIFTAITDTIAWNLLPKPLFQKLFRQDLLVASLFRNFLLAERIMRSYDCTPMSSPKLPPTSNHPMWHALDYALDQCLSKLKIRDNLGPASTPEQFTHSPSPFFEEQLTAFEVWLGLGYEKRHPPEQLPIVLQVLLSQVHRVRALELLSKFLDLGWWAVNLALSVGIFPYVLKLLQSSAKELRPLLVFIWAKILAVDQTCQADLVRDGSHKYFIDMITDSTLSLEHRTMAVFVLSNIVRSYPQGQQAALQANSIATCLLSLEDTDPAASTAPGPSLSNLHKWVCICLGLTWQDFPSARWCGVRDSAHEKIATILSDGNPEVRAAAVFALGSFINGIDRTEHSNSIDHACVLMILNKLGDREASALVRQEMIVALHNFVLVFENQFISCADRNMVTESQYFGVGGQGGFGSLVSPVNLRRIGNNTRLRTLLGNNAGHMMTITGSEAYAAGLHVTGGDAGSGNVRRSESMRRVASSSSLANLMNVFIPPGLPSSSMPPQHHFPASTVNIPLPSSTCSVSGIYNRVYNYLVSLERDPHPGVSLLARTVLDYIRSKAIAKSQQQPISKSLAATRELESSIESCSSGSEPATPTGADGGSTPTRVNDPTKVQSPSPGTPIPSSITPIVATKFADWCWSQFSRPCGGSSIGGTGAAGGNHSGLDPQNPSVCTRNWVYSRNAKTRRDCFKRTKNFPGKLDDQIVGKNLNEMIRNGGGSCVKFHPYENLVVVGGSAVIDSAGGSGQSSAAGSLSSLDISRIGSNAMNMIVDKSVFLVFEYDDTSHLSSYYPHHQSSSPSSSSSSVSTPTSQPQTPTSFATAQPRVINRTEIEHTSNPYVHSSYCTTPPVITSLEWINSSNNITTDVSSLLATGCNDACVRIYKPTLEARQSLLVTAWAVGSTSRVNRLLMKYEHDNTNLIVAYNSSRSSTLGVWDVGCERLVREIGGSGLVDKAVMEESVLGELVTCLDCNRCESHVFVVGGEDGSVRILDLRVPPAECVTTTWRDLHTSNARVQSVRLRHDRSVVAGSSDGRVRFFDLRSKSPTKTVETTMDVTAVDVHPNLPYFGIGTSSSTVNVYGFHGQATFLSNSIREGFGGFGRIGLANNSITSVAFHEFKPFVGFIDSYSHFSVYKAKK